MINTKRYLLGLAALCVLGFTSHPAGAAETNALPVIQPGQGRLLTLEQRAERFQMVKDTLAELRAKRAAGTLTAEEQTWLDVVEKRGGRCVDGRPALGANMTPEERTARHQEMQQKLTELRAKKTAGTLTSDEVSLLNRLEQGPGPGRGHGAAMGFGGGHGFGPRHQGPGFNAGPEGKAQPAPRHEGPGMGPDERERADIRHEGPGADRWDNDRLAPRHEGRKPGMVGLEDRARADVRHEGRGSDRYARLDRDFRPAPRHEGPGADRWVNDRPTLSHEGRGPGMNGGPEHKANPDMRHEGPDPGRDQNREDGGRPAPRHDDTNAPETNNAPVPPPAQ